MLTIDDLRAKVKSLRDQLRDAEAELLNAEIQASPIKIGDVYIDNKGRKAQVVLVFRRYSREGLAGKLRLFKKDGSLGNNRADTGDWHGWRKVEPGEMG